MLGSQLVISALQRRGVTTIFSLSGNQIMPLYDACIDAGIRIVHVRHEAAAVFMADAWAQITGEVGVAMLTAGPGITNGIAPLYSAAQAESPVLLISGDSSIAEDGKGAFQEMDQTAITSPLTKLSHRPMSAAQLACSVDLAVNTAMAPRRGPVHLALPFDLLSTESGIDALPAVPPALESPALEAKSLNMLTELLSNAQRPLILAGPTWAREHMREARARLQGALQVPIVAMESPRGLNDPSLGTLRDLLAQSDLVVLAGKSLDFTLGFGAGKTFNDNAQIAVLEPDKRMLERAQSLLGNRLTLACQVDALQALTRLTDTQHKPSRKAWLEQAAQAIAVRQVMNPAPAQSDKLDPRALCETVQQFLNEATEPLLICDGGEFGQWAQAYCDAPIRIINGMSGAIGAGICYAIAAKIARPQATVVALMGDGTSGFHFMEFDTAVREQAPFIAVVGNDLRWNAEHLIQMRTYGADRLIGCELADSARYHDASRALGGTGAAPDTAARVASALHSAVASQLPTCLNVAIDGRPAPVFSAAKSAAAAH